MTPEKEKNTVKNGSKTLYIIITVLLVFVTAVTTYALTIQSNSDFIKDELVKQCNENKLAIAVVDTKREQMSKEIDRLICIMESTNKLIAEQNSLLREVLAIR